MPLIDNDLKLQLERVFQSRGAYLFLGEQAIGKFTLARGFALDQVRHSQNLLIIEADGDSIGIDQIHSLSSQLALKSTAGGVRVLIVRDADLLTLEAQNAFLKTLEEPPIDTLIILTAHERSRLLPTIVSRCRIVYLVTPAIEPLKAYLEATFKLKPAAAADIIELASGKIGEAIRLTTDSEQMEQRQQIVDTAKAVLDAPDVYQRLKLLLKKEDQVEPKSLVVELSLLLKKQLRLAAKTSNRTALKTLLGKLQACQRVAGYLYRHGNAKLAITYLAMILE